MKGWVITREQNSEIVANAKHVKIDIYRLW